MGRRAGALIAAMIVCLVATPSASAQIGPLTSVVGGELAPIADFPFMARVVSREGLVEYICSGTVVAPNMVLTAAHCLLNESETAFLAPARFEVLTGTSSLSVPGVVSRAERLVIDPGYESSGIFEGWHDAGLIQLTAPIAAPAVKLATSQVWGPGTLGYIVGWGLTEPEGPLPAELQVGETVVQSQGFCEQEIGSHFHPLAELCSVDYPTYESATCNGDSGGPMLMVSNGELVEIGLTSFAVEEGCPTDSPRVDTRADAVSTWVQREITAHPPKVVPPPTITTPTPAPKTPAPATTRAPVAAPELPGLATAAAKHDAFNVLQTDRRLGSRFRAHTGYRISCRSTGRTAAQCTVSWSAGNNDYWGTVTVFDEWEGTTPVWNYRYSIRAVDDWCSWHSGHRATCKIESYRN